MGNRRNAANCTIKPCEIKHTIKHTKMCLTIQIPKHFKRASLQGANRESAFLHVRPTKEHFKHTSIAQA